MAEQVKVTSIDALETFRAALIVFMTTAHRSVDEAGDEVRRARHWIQNDQRLHWEGEARRRHRMLDMAKAELFSAKLSGLRETTAAQENAVLKAKRAFAEAEEKLQNIKAWNRNYDGCVDPLIKRLEGLRHFLDHDLPKAVAYLVQAQRTLVAYTETKASPGGGGAIDGGSQP